MIPMLWPVSENAFTLEPIAVFFDYSSAVSFVNRPDQGFGTRERYIAEPKYDRRKVVSDVLGEQLTEVRSDPFGDAFQARAVAAAQSRRVSPSRPSGLPSLSQRKSA